MKFWTLVVDVTMTTNVCFSLRVAAFKDLPFRRLASAKVKSLPPLTCCSSDLSNRLSHTIKIRNDYLRNMRTPSTDRTPCLVFRARQHVCMDSCGLFLGLYALDTADSNRHQPKVLQLSFGTNLTLTVFHMAFSQKDAPYAAATKEIISRKNMAA